MRIENSFTVAAAPDVAWAWLKDVRRIAPCMPGVELTEDLGEGRYRGKATVKIGPMTFSFAGDAELYDIDDNQRCSRLKGKGGDTKGRGQVQVEVAFMLTEAPEGSRVDIVTDLALTGLVAQYGRASGLIREIANQLCRQFAGNLEKLITNDDASDAPEPRAIGGVGLFFRASKAVVVNKLKGKGAS